MPNYHSAFLQLMAERGLVHQCSDERGLDDYLRQKNACAYIGFDCTAPSLHIGHLMALMTLRHFQKMGHQPIIIMGGGTTLIGDPSGKDSQRPLLSLDEINANIATISKTIARFIDLDNALILNNHQWLKDLNYIDFLRDIGRHFSVNRMLGMDSVKLRLERQQPLSFIEFNYMLIQAYDFFHLAQHHNCRLQMGGSDQWGNMIYGVDLTRRLLNQEVFALTMPLLTTQEGKKMGKTEKGALWLSYDSQNPDYSCAPFDYWQYWRNIKDADISSCLRIFTELPLAQIIQLEKLKDEEANEAKKILAFHATALAHSEDEAKKAQKTAQYGFDESSQSGELALPHFDIAAQKLQSGIGLLEAYVLSQLVQSNSEARRFVKGGAVKVNGKTILDENYTLTTQDLTKDNAIILTIGRKKIAMLKIV